jgi:hypothetical protein
LYHCFYSRRGWGTFTVGIAVEFKGGKEPPLELKHALSFDEGGQWTEIALPVSRAAEAPGRSDKKKEKKMKTKQQHATSHDQLFSAIVTNEPKARLQVRHTTQHTHDTTSRTHLE